MTPIIPPAQGTVERAVAEAWLKEFKNDGKPGKRVDLSPGSDPWMTDYSETPLFTRPPVDSEALKALEKLADDLTEVKLGDQVYKRTSLSKDSIARTVAELRRIIAALSTNQGSQSDGTFDCVEDSEGCE